MPIDSMGALSIAVVMAVGRASQSAPVCSSDCVCVRYQQ